MSAFMPSRPTTRVDEALTEWLDRTLHEEDERRGWRVRAAQWRARRLAEWVFEGSVDVRLQEGSSEVGRAGAYPFRGLVHLDVPFEGHARHRERERLFVACAGSDPILARIPFVYVFCPVDRDRQEEKGRP